MTKEEAIDILVYERDNDAFISEYRDTVHEALDMGIKALQCVIESEKFCREIFRKATCKLSYEDFIKDVYKKS